VRPRGPGNEDDINVIKQALYRVSKKSHFPTKMRSHCLFPVVDKSGTSCYHLVTRVMRPTDSQQVVPTSLISSARMSC
jgi:hypothetical protein